MVLKENHTDSLVGMKHYKYQQTYMEIPIEGAGCIEHFSSENVLDFINAKVAVDIRANPKPKINPKEAVDLLLDILKKKTKGVKFAWEFSEWKEQAQFDLHDSTATWYPTPDLIWAIDNYNDVGFIIDGSRLKLAYKITITTIAPKLETFDYYIDAQNGMLLFSRPRHVSFHGDVYSYGIQWIDGKWHGGFCQCYELNTDENDNGFGHRVETKIYNPFEPWNSMSSVNGSESQLNANYKEELAAHYHISNSWKFFKNYYSRYGIDNIGTKVRVKTRLNMVNAFYDDSPEYPYYFIFGYSPQNISLSYEPSIVGHEFTHGITNFTAGLSYVDQTGALNESFSDIFGTVIQALMLEQTYTDWIIGNRIPNNPPTFLRSLESPNDYGIHWKTGQYDQNGLIITELGQPKSYQGQFWYSCSSCPSDIYHDNGGVHINSGVQNHWFQLLTDGNSNIQGIGIKKAAKITYKALTDDLMPSAQYYDSKEATIKSAIELYGECSIEHQSTVKAWNAVGISAGYNCSTTAIQNEAQLDINIYPNPANSQITIELPFELQNPIEVYDAQGRLIQTYNEQGILLKINLSHYDNGLYLLKFNYNQNILVKRIIVQK